MNIHKAMRIPDGIFQTNHNSFLKVNQKGKYKLNFGYYLWLPYLDQPQSDVVVFAIIYFHIYIILVTDSKHVIRPNAIITFNEEFENISTEILEPTNIDDYLHEKYIVIFITKDDLKKNVI